MKVNRQVVPVENPAEQIRARDRIMEILADEDIHIPLRFREASDKLALYNPKGILEKANALLIEGDEGAYDLDNRLNDLNGKDWTKFTCSWFIFNALKSDLKEEREFLAETEDHPATYSPTMIENFINFFTKEGMTVLDPFAGIGSTLVAANRTGRNGYGIELNKKYFEISKARLPEFANQIFNMSCEEIFKISLPVIDFCISSPPYWDVLNRSTKDFRNIRSKKGLDSTYSDKEEDLGNIENYEEFVTRLCKIYENIYHTLRDDAYVVIILKNVKKNGVLYPLAWDVAKNLSELYVLKMKKYGFRTKLVLHHMAIHIHG